MSENQIWGEMNLQPDTVNKWQNGPLVIWFQKLENELWVGYQYFSADADPVPETPPADLNWSRFTIDTPNPKLDICPVFPDRSVVIKTEYPFWLTTKAQVKIYVRVPIWVRVEIKSAKIKLAEIPVVVLSNTWFGDNTSGQLCYWISSSARQTMEPDAGRQFLAICPINIKNKTEEDLLVEKFCFRVSELSLFYDGEQLWSDETRVNYRGSGDISLIDVTGKAPQEAKSARKIGEPRHPRKKGITQKTFETLKDLSGIGLFI